MFLFLLAACLGTAAPAHGADEELGRVLKQALADEHTDFKDRYHAEVWYRDMSQRLKRYIADRKQRIALLRMIRSESRRAGLKPELVLAVIDVESGFNRYALSRAGAHGLMQVMPFWLKEIGRPGDNLFNIKTNLRLGCTILKYYLDKEAGDLTRALARYNGSRRKSRYPDRVLTALNERWFRG